MKNLLKLSALAAVIAASATYTFADTVTLTSGTNTLYLGSVTGGGSMTGAQVVGLVAGASAPAITTLAAPNTHAVVVGDGGTWLPAIGGSQWVSQQLGDQPGGVHANDSSILNGLYFYADSFTTTGGVYNGAMLVMADDTVTVFLNGTKIDTTEGLGIGGDGKCSDNIPNCTSVQLVAFGSATPGFNSNGANNLIFVVEQTGHVAEGLDYAITTSTVPEPSTLLMLGTGLFGSAGALFRKMRS